MRQKHTKIIATISDRNCSVELIKQLHDFGMDAVRINSAHCTIEGATQVVQNVRTVSDRLAIIIDTKGPELRNVAPLQPIELKENNTITIRSEHHPSTTECIFIPFPQLISDTPEGAKILIDDGFFELKVVQKHHDHLVCIIQSGGIIDGAKTINVPGVHIPLPSITDKDRAFLDFAITHDIDFIAHSFVRNKHDVLALKEILQQKNSQIKIIAKIENKEGVDNIDEIIEEVFGIMIARGDLGVELPAEDVPIVQKDIAKKCNRRARPVIVATQMLESMTKNPRPTRAEVSDVANAVFDGADVVMLSGETAKGKYPVLAVQTMAKIIKRVETQLPNQPKLPEITTKKPVRAFLAKAAVLAAQDVQARAIIIPTLSGISARIVSSYRSRTVIYAKCFSPRVVRELRLCYGVFSDMIDMSHGNNTDELIKQSLHALLNENRLHPTDVVIILGVTPGSADGANFLEINEVKNILHL